MSDISEKGASFVQDLGDAVRQNPISAALIGMGVFWLFGGRLAVTAGDIARRSHLERIPDHARDAFNAAGSTLASSVESIGSSIGSVTEKAQNGAASALDGAARFGREGAGTLSEYARSIPESGSEMMENARSNLAELFRTQPLALGAVGLTIGALIAAALPATELEAEYLGESSAAVKQKAEAFAVEQTSRATAAAESAINAAAQEARDQGLTVEGAKSAAGEISNKVGRILDTTGKSISERVG